MGNRLELLFQKLIALIKEYNQNLFWRRVITGFAAVVVFVVTYNLIIPVISMDLREADQNPSVHREKSEGFVLHCPLEVHEHFSSCYANVPVLDEDGRETGKTEKVLVCGKADYVVHTHEENCYQTVTKEDGSVSIVLVCELPEVEEHKHTDKCYQGGNVLICGKDELHTHTEACYENGPEGESPEEMGWVSYVTDGNGKKTMVGDPAHLVCGKPEVIRHQHTSDCLQ